MGGHGDLLNLNFAAAEKGPTQKEASAVWTEFGGKVAVVEKLMKKESRRS